MAFRILICIFMLCVVPSLSADEIIVEGSSAMGDNATAARNDAMKNAYQFAVNSALYKLYDRDLVDQNQFKLMELYDKADSFITSTKILSEEQNTDSQTVDVRLQIEVDMPAIKEYLAERGVALSSERISTILPLIAEKASLTETNGLEKTDFSDVERSLARFFAQNNFSFINPYFRRPSTVADSQAQTTNQMLPRSSSYTEIKAPELVKLGRRFNAGLVCSGYVWTNCTGNVALNRTDCETNTSLQLLSTDTSKVLAAKRVQETASSSDPESARTASRAKAFKVISDSLLYQMKHNWDKRPAAKFKVVIKGIKNYGTYLKARDVLVGKHVSGFNNVVERYQSKGEVVFEGERRADVNQVSRDIVAKCFGAEDVSITKRDDSVLELNLKG